MTVQKPVEKLEDEPALAASVLGRTIRRLRQERKLSLHSLASQAEMSVSMLSQIERGISSPSLKSLTKIRLSLGVPISSLFETASSSDNPGGQIRAPLAERPKLRSGAHLSREGAALAQLAKDLQFMILTSRRAGARATCPTARPARRAASCSRASLRLYIGEDVVDVHKGDSFQFESTTIAPLQEGGDNDGQSAVDHLPDPPRTAHLKLGQFPDSKPSSRTSRLIAFASPETSPRRRSPRSRS